MIDKIKKQFVQDGLNFVRIITSLNKHFFGIPSFIHISSNQSWSWDHPWLYFDALRNYLLLTCFDFLGQPNGFSNFSDWLSKKDSCEQDRALEEAAQKQSLLVNVPPINALTGVKFCIIEIQNKVRKYPALS